MLYQVENSNFTSQIYDYYKSGMIRVRSVKIAFFKHDCSEKFYLIDTASYLVKAMTQSDNTYKFISPLWKTIFLRSFTKSLNMFRWVILPSGRLNNSCLTLTLKYPGLTGNHGCKKVVNPTKFHKNKTIKFIHVTLLPIIKLKLRNKKKEKIIITKLLL